MKKDSSGQLRYSPSDLVRYLASPFASWMDRYHLEYPGEVSPDEQTDDQKLIAQSGNQHERTVLQEFRASEAKLVEIPRDNFDLARRETLSAMEAKVPVIYQAALEIGQFFGFTDFLLFDESGRYQVWDTKLARSPKPYYALQLCCYSEMLATTAGVALPEKFGIILGGKDRVEFRLEDFIYYYRRIKTSFLSLQQAFTGKPAERPDPLPRADHGRWTSHAERFFQETDHLVQVAGITVGQIKKLKRAGITTVTALSTAVGIHHSETRPKLVRKTCLAGASSMPDARGPQPQS